MREVIEIEIIAVISREKSYGKNKTCFPFTCDISVNAGSKIEAKVITFDSAIARSVEAGKKYEGVENEYKGEISFILNKDISSQKSSATVQPTTPSQQAKLAEPSQTSHVNVGQSINAQQLSFARSYAKDIVVALIEKKNMTNSEMVMLWNTLSDCSMAWFDRYTKAAHPDTVPWGSILIKEQLADDVRKKKLDASFLRELWSKSMYDELDFVEELRKVLAGEGLPF